MRIVENKAWHDKIDGIMKNMLRNWEYIHNANDSQVTRVIICWDVVKMKCTLLSMEDQAMTCMVDSADGRSFGITMVYGRNKVNGRRSLW